uniref:hypothetical protein n=1 Tax=Clostridium sp. NkU-1 TaxID=1095009 RepID=UPI000A5998B9
MMEQVEAGNVSTIIVKDHSRLGRNRLVIGYLMEEKFPDYVIRYIAINDAVDTPHTIKVMALHQMYWEKFSVSQRTPESIQRSFCNEPWTSMRASLKRIYPLNPRSSTGRENALPIWISCSVKPLRN